MIERHKIQIVAGVTAVVGLIVSIMTTRSADATVALKVYSYGTSVSTLLLLAYEHFIWHWPVVRKVTRRPDIRGTWLGELRSSYERDGKPIDPIPTIVRIHQTASTQTLTLFTGESSSVTEQSRLLKETDGRWRVAWTYANKPRTSVRHRSDVHLGTAELVYDERDGLTGSYYTDRLTRGELILPKKSKRLFGSVVAAQRAEVEFHRPKSS